MCHVGTAQQPTSCNRPRLGLKGDKAGDICHQMIASRPKPNVNKLILLVQRCAGQGQPVFPAIKRANPADLCRMGPQAKPITICPHQTFTPCRLELAVTSNQFTAGIDCDSRCVDRSTDPFRNTANNHDFVFFGERLDIRNKWVIQRHCLVPIKRIGCFLFLR